MNMCGPIYNGFIALSTYMEEVATPLSPSSPYSALPA